MEANTLVRHAEAMAAAFCSNVRDMVGVEFAPLADSLGEVRFVPSKPMTVMIHFTGAIQGEFALSLEEVVAARMIGCWSEGMATEELRANRGDFAGFVKEALNTSVGQVIPDLEKEFDALTFLPPVVIWGELEYPDVPSGRMVASGELGDVECFFVLNMMGLELGDRLQAAIQALRDSVKDASAAKRSVDSMLEAFPQGLVTVDRKGVVRPGHARRTASKVGLVDSETLAGLHVVDLLGFEEELGRDMEFWLDIVHDRHGTMPFRDLVGLCPVSERQNRRGLLLRLEWVPLVGEGGVLDGLLLMIEDVTEKRRIEQEMRKLSKLHDENVELITQIVNLEPDEVQDFVFDSTGLLDQARQIVQGAHRDRQFIEGLYRTIHTLKGNSGQFQFKGLQNLAMEIENSISRLRDEALLDDTESVSGEQFGLISEGLEEAEAYIRRLEDMRSKLGSKSESVQDKAARSVPTVMVPLEQVDILSASLWAAREAGIGHGWSSIALGTLAQTAAMAASLREVELSRLAPSLQQVAEKAGARLKKRMRFSMVGGVAVDVEVVRELHRCFVHLLNNSLDHGIESPEEREAAHKLETGLISIEAFREGRDVVVAFMDDGRGIDFSALRGIIAGKGLVPASDAARLTDLEACDYLFHSGFTTRGTVTEFSGRGVGLDVVRSTLQQLGGSVAIESSTGKGTRFVLRIPVEVAQPSQRFVSTEVPA